MKITYHKKYVKRFDKLQLKMKIKVEGTIKKFQTNPFDPTLDNHPLKRNMLGKRAISVTGDVRIIFKEFENYTLVLMLDVGSHNQVYN